MLAGRKDLDDVVRTVEEVAGRRRSSRLLARLFDAGATPRAERPGAQHRGGRDGAVRRRPRPSCDDALDTRLSRPRARRSRVGGVGWRRAPAEHAIVEFVPADDLRQRLDVLPQTYLERPPGHRAAQARDDARAGQAALLEALAADESTSLVARGALPRPAAPGPRLGSGPGARESWAATRSFAVRGHGRRADGAAAGHADEPPRPGGLRRRTSSVRFPDPADPSVRARRSRSPTLREALEAHGSPADGGANTGLRSTAPDLDAYVDPRRSPRPATRPGRRVRGRRRPA